jgi:TonB-dependent SusC/RagA subfamily outer membrane receptor
VKGAAAASLYGSRAGNGVINITTRTGKSGSEGVRFRAQVEYGTSSIENEYQFPQYHFMVMNEDMSRFCIAVANQPDCSRTVDIYAETRRINNNPEPIPLPPVNFLGDAGIARNPGAVNMRSLYQTNQFPLAGNPVRQFLTNGQTYNGTIDATGRVGRTNFFASLNSIRQEGAVRFMEGYTRNAIRLNLDHQFGNDVDVQFRTSFTEAADFNSGAAFFRITRQPVNADLLARDDFGRLFIRTVAQQQGSQNDNPAYNAENFRPVNRISRWVGSMNVRWRPLTWLDAEGTAGYDTRRTFQVNQTNLGYRTIPNNTTPLGSVSRNAASDNSMNLSMNVTARKGFFEDALNSRLTLRYLYEEQRGISQSGSGSQLAVPGLQSPNAAIANFSIGGGEDMVRQLGMFANLDLDYKGRYIFGALVRRDAASLFGAANRWQTYGRGSFAWRVSDEPWFNVPMFSDLKLRASRGTAGNRPNFTAQYETFGIGAGGALTPGALGNRFLRPEVSTETEYGVDMELFSKYGLTITHANNVIDQQLLPVPPPAAAGFTTQWNNAGELTNNTIEVSLNLPIVSRPDFNYAIRLNYDRTTSLISRLDIPTQFNSGGEQGSESMYKYEQGKSIGAMYGRVFIRDCNQLKGAAAQDCGPGKTYQANRDGFIVYTGAGNTVNDGITKNLWFTQQPAAETPWGAEALSWGMPILLRDNETGAVIQPEIGNSLPRYRWSMQHTAGYKRLTAFALVDATIGKSVWNYGRQWSLGDFMHGEVDQAGAGVGNARPIGYYYRALSAGGIGGLYDVLGPNNNSMEDGGFARLREVTLGYRIGRIGGIGDWNASIIGRNLYTWTNYRGFDPEVGATGGTQSSAVLNAIDVFGFPNLRQFTFSLSTSF